MASLAVSVEVDGRFAIAVIRILAAVAPIIGRERARELAERAAHRLVRVRVDGGRWQRVR
jgi:hypothetical protein